MHHARRKERIFDGQAREVVVVIIGCDDCGSIPRDRPPGNTLRDRHGHFAVAGIVLHKSDLCAIARAGDDGGIVPVADFLIDKEGIVV